MSKTTILAAVAMLITLVGFSANPVSANGCDVTITAASSIQATVDTNPGNVVCLDDSGGIFFQKVIFGAEDSGTTLMAKPGTSPIIDGTGVANDPPGGRVTAIELLVDITDVKFLGLEIRKFTGIGIRAQEAPTSDVLISYNYIHSNERHGVRTDSEENLLLHFDWEVKDNILNNNGRSGLVFINATDSSIKDNLVRNNARNGISVEAINYFGFGSVIVEDVEVKRNDVSGSARSGIRVASEIEDVIGGTAQATDMKVQDNNVHGNEQMGIFLLSTGPGAILDSTRLDNNNVTVNGGGGIFLEAENSGVITENELLNNHVGNNGSFGIGLNARDDGSTNKNKVDLNLVYSNVHSGIVLGVEGPGGVVEENKLEDNTVRYNGLDGFTLFSFGAAGSVNDNELDDNNSTGNALAGFSSPVYTEDNLFTQNRADLNGTFGYFDGGAGNTFEDNSCNFNSIGGSSPGGLCSP